ncbi:DsbA family protein [Deinococcus sp. VB142]|uniref:DsbA family protein n=1 Tax=Deinococcus sp. VB142 TaxID=3112952 RepID=A0AAU6Q1Y9_9DEIO
MTPPKTQLTYVTDTYCVWCWAFGDSLREFARRNAERLTVEVLPAGMLVGERVVPVGEKPRVLEGAERVTELTGTPFGEGFRAAVRDGRTVLDSTVSAVAFWAAMEQAPERALEIGHALQKAWYVDGADLHDAEALANVARELGLNAEQFLDAVADPAMLAQAENGFERRKTLPVKGYPTLLVHTPDGPKRIGGATATPEKLEADFEAVLRGEEIAEEEE